MPKRLTRRQLLRNATVATVGVGLCRSRVWGESQSPNEKLNIGIAGVSGRGGSNMMSVAGENIAALCDVDDRKLAGAAKRFPKAKTYHDWRKMLDQQDLDAVVCSTTEHTHALVSVWAMRRGLHVDHGGPICLEC